MGVNHFILHCSGLVLVSFAFISILFCFLDNIAVIWVSTTK